MNFLPDTSDNKALEYKRSCRHYEAISYSFNNIGAIYNEMGFYDKAMDFAQKSLLLKLQYGNPKDVANSYNQISKIHKNKHWWTR